MTYNQIPTFFEFGGLHCGTSFICDGSSSVIGGCRALNDSRRLRLPKQNLIDDGFLWLVERQEKVV